MHVFMVAYVVKKLGIASCVYLLITAIFFWPLCAHPATKILDPYDGYFINWTMNWVQFSLAHQPSQLYNAPIFAPYSAALTFSDPFISGALLSWPFVALTHEPLMATTVNVLFALVSTAIFFYLFIYELTENFEVSFLAGLFASFGVTHLHYLGHLHTLMIQGIPLALWAWLRFRQNERVRFLFLIGLAFLFQALNSPFSAYLFLLSMGLFVFDRKSWEVLGRNFWKICTVFAPCIAIVGLFYPPYFHSANVYQSYRSIREAAHFSLSINDFFDPVRVSLFLLVLYVIILAILIWKNWKNFSNLFSQLKRRKNFSFFLGSFFVGIVAIILTLGPALKWHDSTVKIPILFFHPFPIPLPYSIAYYILPGFKAFRTPSRWLIIAHFAFLTFFSLLLKKIKVPRFLIFVCVVIIFFEAKQFLVFYTVPDYSHYPTVYKWLATSSAKTVVHLPTYTYDMPNAQREVERMQFSFAGNSPATNLKLSYQLFSGYSGWTPLQRLNEMNLLHVAPFSVEALHVLQKNGADTVVIHLDELNDADRQLAENLTTKTSQKPLYSDQNTLVFPLAVLESNSSSQICQ